MAHLGWAPRSAGFILRPWGCRTAVSRARPTFSEGPFPSQKNLVCLMVILTSIPGSAMKAAELGAASSLALITSCWAQHFEARRLSQMAGRYTPEAELKEAAP